MPFITDIIDFSYYFINGIKPINDLYEKYPEFYSVTRTSILRDVFNQIHKLGECYSSKDYTFCKKKSFLHKLNNQTYSFQKIVSNCNYLYVKNSNNNLYNFSSWQHNSLTVDKFDNGGNDEIVMSRVEIKQFDNNTKMACVFVFKPFLFNIKNTIPDDVAFVFVNSCVDNNSITDNHKIWRDFFADVINVPEDEFEKMWEAKRADEWDYMTESADS